MSGFVELKKDKGKTNRRWFMSQDMDLIIFSNEDGSIREFQLCYDKNKHEQMLSWNIESGYSHMAIDDGDVLESMGHKRTPLIVPNGSYSIREILKKLMCSSDELPDEIVDFVETKMKSHPNYEQSYKE